MAGAEMDGGSPVFFGRDEEVLTRREPFEASNLLVGATRLGDDDRGAEGIELGSA